MKKIIGAACAIFVGLAALLTGCSTDFMVAGTGEEYIASAVLLNEKAKYNTAVVFEVDETVAAGTDVTDRFIQLSPGKAANREISVSVSGAGETGYFLPLDGRLYFTGQMPPAEDDDEGIPNGEIITLSFEKDGETATLEILSVVKRKGDPGDPDLERIALSDEDTFLLYGYDVINSAYMNRREVKITRPILDVDKVNVADLGRRAATSLSELKYSSGQSAKEMLAELYGFNDATLSSSLSLSVLKQPAARSLFDDIWGALGGASSTSASGPIAGALFGGGVESAFVSGAASDADGKTIVQNPGQNPGQTTVPTTRYAIARGLHVTQQEWLRKASPAVLKNLLDDQFEADIATKSAAYILNSYGTHLIVQCYWGGAVEFNYSYTGSVLNSDAQMEDALYYAVTTTAAARTPEQQEMVEELTSKSVFTASSRGGNNTAFTSTGQIVTDYNSWVASIVGKSDLCGLPNIEDSLISIWDIVAEINKAKAGEIEAEFAQRVRQRSVALEAYTSPDTSNEPSAPTTSYLAVTDIIVIPADKSPSFKEYTFVQTEAASDVSNGKLLDANAGLGAAVRIGYTTAQGWGNPGAIAELRMVDKNTRFLSEMKDKLTNNSASESALEGDKWITLELSFGQHAIEKGMTSPFYLQYRRANKNDTLAIDSIGCYVSADPALNPGALDAFPGREFVRDYYGQVTNLTPNAPYTYLTAHKVPFKW
ncbi:MAG: hypothetical protein LBK83_04825 [Treponema sp.]|jgi:hypothetical protein|nr:hypothetical protein [Treponema sp.]